MGIAVLKVMKNLMLLFVLVVSTVAIAETQADGELGDSQPTDQAQEEIGLFENCTLNYRESEDARIQRKRFKLIHNSPDAKIYEASVGDVTAMVVHNSGKLATYSKKFDPMSRYFKFSEEERNKHEAALESVYYKIKIAHNNEDGLGAEERGVWATEDHTGTVKNFLASNVRTERQIMSRAIDEDSGRIFEKKKFPESLKNSEEVPAEDDGVLKYTISCNGQG